jgi:TPR repeat protein
MKALRPTKSGVIFLTIASFAPIGAGAQEYSGPKCLGVIDNLTEQGKSVLKDLNFTPEMIPLIEEKADKGDGRSQYLLGWICGGKGVPKNLTLAYEWISLSADGGFEPSKKLLVTVGEKMTPEQIAEARERAQAWSRTHEKLAK